MSLTLRVSIGLVAGLLLGLMVSTSHATWLMRLPAFFDPIGVVFVNAIRVAVIPLIVSSLIVGVARAFSTATNVTGWLCAGAVLSRSAVATPRESLALPNSTPGSVGSGAQWRVVGWKQ